VVDGRGTDSTAHSKGIFGGNRNVNLIVIIAPQYIHMSKPQFIHFKYAQFLCQFKLSKRRYKRKESEEREEQWEKKQQKQGEKKM
jgi:hypothetical protein